MSTRRLKRMEIIRKVISMKTDEISQLEFSIWEANQRIIYLKDQINDTQDFIRMHTKNINTLKEEIEVLKD